MGRKVTNYSEPPSLKGDRSNGRLSSLTHEGQSSLSLDPTVSVALGTIVRQKINQTHAKKRAVVDDDNDTPSARERPNYDATTFR